MTREERMAQDPGMFPNIRSRNYGYEPTTAEMNAAREAARHQCTVYMTGYQVFTFDLSDKIQVEQYKSERVKLYDKAASGEVKIHKLEHQWCSQPPKWIVHIEYSEFKFEKIDLLAEKDADNEEDKPTDAAGGDR